MFSCFRTPRPHHPQLITLPYNERSCGRCHENAFDPVTLIEVTPATPQMKKRQRDKEKTPVANGTLSAGTNGESREIDVKF
ncbi:hypothetical protein QR680_014845 [Steinernema hermaphroditum]|uniref:Uncharacterized protein n=1 Tax=Steinernema hermaphroditum TaxID=289476 RepID=A0AA39M3X2_9BILA|nr:hypothetical protein QR680_014845 [Steinernema hermaphroditum]